MDKAWINQLIAFPFVVRVVVASLMMSPIGLCLGMYFPSGLLSFGGKYPQTTPWAWGLNSAFSVPGSILAIIFAQHFGFTGILLVAIAIYFLAAFSFLGTNQ